jgi:photosystem II stability/assembly factor-like uncharacterized protein
MRVATNIAGVISAVLLAASSMLAQEPAVESIRGDAMPALTLGSLRIVPEYPAPGERTRVEAEIRNGATSRTPDFVVALDIDANRITKTVPGLDAGGVTTISLPWSSPRRGTHIVTVTADPEQFLTEQNRLDNSMSMTGVVLPPPAAGVNFRIHSLRQNGNTLAVTITNYGAVTGETPVMVQANGRSVFVRSTGKMRSGRTTTIIVPWPADTLPAKLTAVVNPRYRALEARRGDNVVSTDMRRQVNLSVRQLSVAAHATAVNGSRQITISFQVVNTGRTAIATAFRTSIVPGDGGGGPPLFVQTAALPAGGAVMICNTIVRPEGDFDVRVEADADHRIAEDEEGDNAATYRYTNPTPDIDRWVSIGPDFMATYDSVGQLGSIAVDPSSSSTIYVASRTSGVWKTTDRGTTWAPITDSLGTLNISAIAVDPLTPATVYIASPRYGIFRSEDAGISWIQLSGSASLGIDEWNVVLLKHPTDPEVLYLTSADGVYRSGDHGETWTLSKSGGRGDDLVMSSADSNTLYAAIEGKGVYKTTTGGVAGDSSWTLLAGGLPTSDFERIRLAQVILLPTDLFALVYRPSAKENEVYFSTDSGSTWSKTYTFPSELYLATLTANVGHDVIYTGGIELYRSNTGASSFTKVDGPHADHHAFATSRGPAVTLYTACDGGIYGTTDGGSTWTSIGRGIRNAEFFDHAVSAIDPLLVIGGTQDNGTVVHADVSDSWTSIRDGDGGTVDIDPSMPVLFSMNQYAHSIAASVGTVSKDLTFLGDERFHDRCFNAHYQFHDAWPDFMLLACDGLWRRNFLSGPVAEPWHRILSVADIDPSVHVVRSAVDSKNRYYAASASGTLLVGTNGAEWKNVFQHPGFQAVTDITLDSDPDVLYVSFNGSGGAARIYRMRWTSTTLLDAQDITNDLPADFSVASVAIDRADPLTLYAAGNGVYRGRPDGAGTWTWTRYDDGLPAGLDVRDLEVEATTGHLRAATFGRGVYEVITY